MPTTRVQKSPHSGRLQASSCILSTKQLLHHLLGTSPGLQNASKCKRVHGTCNRLQAKTGCPQHRTAGKHPNKLFCPCADAASVLPITCWTLINTGMLRTVLMAVTPSQGGHHSVLGWQPCTTTVLSAAELLGHPKVPTKLLQGTQI